MAILAGAGVQASGGQLSGGTVAPGRDFLDPVNTVTQNGTIETISLRVNGTPSIKVKVWRLNGANYDFVGQSTLPALSAGVNTAVVLDTPIVVLAGDIIGLHLANQGSGQEITIAAASPDAIIWTGGASDFTTSQPASSFSTTFAYSMNMSLEGTPTGGGDVITVDDLDLAYIRDLTTGEIDITLSGTYSGTPTTIERQIHYTDDDSVVPGFSWATYIASPAGGTYSGSSITLQSTTRGYYAAVRFSNDTGVTDTSTTTVVADKYLVYGESLARDMETDGALTPTAGLVFYQNRDTGVLSVPTTGYGNVALANAISAHTGYGTIITTSGSGGMAMLQVNNPANYLYSGGAPTTNYTNVLTGYNQGRPARAAILLVGANDSFFGNSTISAFQDVFALHFAEFRADVSRPAMKVFASLTGVHLSGSAASTYGDFVLAQKSAYEVESNLFFTAHYDATLQDDVHPTGTATGYGLIGTRIANAIITNELGGSAAWQHPDILSVTQLTPTTTELTIDLGSGSDIGPASGITGLELSDDGGSTYAVSISSVTRSATDKILATHASTTVTHGRYMYGNNPNRTTPAEAS